MRRRQRRRRPHAGPGDRTYDLANGTQATTQPGPVYLWFVLTDSHGGIDFASAEFDVTP